VSSFGQQLLADQQGTMLFTGGISSLPSPADHPPTNLHCVIVGGRGGILALPACHRTICHHQASCMNVTQSMHIVGLCYRWGRWRQCWRLAAAKYEHRVSVLWSVPMTGMQWPVTRPVQRSSNAKWAVMHILLVLLVLAWLLLGLHVVTVCSAS